MDKKGAPRLVALGHNGTWACFWDDRRFAWNLKGGYDDSLLHALEADDNPITFLALDPFSSNYFAHHENGLLRWSVSFGSTENTRFREACYKYMQERAREDGTTLETANTMTASRAFDSSSYTITPTTKFGEDKSLLQGQGRTSGGWFGYSSGIAVNIGNVGQVTGSLIDIKLSCNDRSLHLSVGNPALIAIGLAYLAWSALRWRSTSRIPKTVTGQIRK